ncbi:glycosyltransferase family 25 protein [Mesorhizobium sp. VNQ89]|uniref:glycosyltransferase family 25 protein n=1 Tax=Mesorhizobium quangtriensis TaxID=3157709 RepID=UPI0032B83A5C
MLAFYINLDRRTDRRAFMEEQLVALGLDIQRLPATTPDTLTSNDIAPLSLAAIGETMSPVEVAISVSHFRAWKHMFDEGRDHVLVIEDDHKLSSRLAAFLTDFDWKKPDVGLLRLEAQLCSVRLRRWAEPGPLGTSLYMPVGYQTGAGAYIISADYARRILSSPKRFAMPVDDILYSPRSPFRDVKRIRCTVPGMAIFRWESSPEFDVPESILISDAQPSRGKRQQDEKKRSRPPLRERIGREILRLLRQLANGPKPAWYWLWSKRMVVPFADSGVSAQQSAVRRPG